jgi:ATP-dependent protease ClpP protease subunit
MQKAEAHVYFLDTIGMGGWFYGTTLADVRYLVEGQGSFVGEPAAENTLPTAVYLHFPACQGGDVVEGYAIYNYIRGLAAKGVKTVARIEGLCASIAVLCAIACDTVEMADAALLMVHKPSIDGSGLDADDATAAAELLNKIQAQLVGRYVARTGMSAETANELINKTSWLTADECISYGFVSAKIPDAPLVAPADAAGVLNYYPKSNPAAPMALSEKEEEGLLTKIGNFLREEFGLKPKNEGEPPVTEPVVTNTTVDVTDGEPMYCEGEIAQGTAVYSDEALTTAYPDGTYNLADGREATVATGVVESLADAAEDAAPAAADNTADELAAANALVAQLQAENALKDRKITGLTNKLAKVVPGTNGNPNTPGIQAIPTKNSASGRTAPADSPLRFTR